MKILNPKKKTKAYRGTCHVCKTRVECAEKETKVLVDRDSPEGARHCKCPTCANAYLWVK